jgi:uncharacterized membrane protein YecN with MAPEG domain
MIVWTYLIIGLSLLLYIGTIWYCGKMRGRCGIPAPAMTGHPDFERAVRIQQNTLESLVPFIPALWLFATMNSGLLAAILGFIWLIGRLLYAVGYAKEARKRSLGFMIAAVPLLIFIVGDIAASILYLVRSGG